MSAQGTAAPTASPPRLRFELDDRESEAARAFVEEHAHSGLEAGAIGGAIRYSFTPTSVGTAAVVHCDVCHKALDVTDYESW